MITLWAVAKSGIKIESREYERVTDKCAFRKVGGREFRELRRQEYLRLFDTEAEAVDFVRERLWRKLKNAESAVMFAWADMRAFTAKYGNAKAVKS